MARHRALILIISLGGILGCVPRSLRSSPPVSDCAEEIVGLETQRNVRDIRVVIRANHACAHRHGYAFDLSAVEFSAHSPRLKSPLRLRSTEGALKVGRVLLLENYYIDLVQGVVRSKAGEIVL